MNSQRAGWLRLRRLTPTGFVVGLGIVSLFADMTYEGARSVAGPFLAILGASSAAVGVVAGLGELAGYGLRLVSGRLADRTGRLWLLTGLGYLVNLGAVPLLAIAPSWQVAAVLLVAERVGKAMRNPPRDVMLAQASTAMGRGWGFGVHEALDQAGALVGPLVAAGVLAARDDYRSAFALLAIPAALALLSLGAARLLSPVSDRPPAGPAQGGGSRLPPAFWIYLGGVALVAVGFADFALVAYHFQRTGAVPPIWIPISYAMAMGAGGLGSLVFGRLFDRAGIVVLVPLTAAAALFAPLVFFGGFGAALVGMVLWGMGTSVHESVMAAAVAGLAPRLRLASAYGLFTGTYGVAWFAGSVALGVVYGISRGGLVALSAGSQLAAAVLFFALLRGSSRWGMPAAGHAPPATD